MKINRLIDVKVEIDAPSIPWYEYRGDIEKRAKCLERWSKDFEEFVRDHRSQDPIGLNVIRIYEDQCSHCGKDWDLDGDGVPGCCQKAIDEALSAPSSKED